MKHRASSPILTLLRALRIVFAILLVGTFIFALPVAFSEWSSTCQSDECPQFVLTPEQQLAWQSIGLSLTHYAVLMLAIELLIASLWAGCAVLIFLRRSDSFIGLLVSFTLLLFGVNTLSDGVSALGRLDPLVGNLEGALQGIGIGLFVLVFLTFPDGRFVPHWTRYPAALVGLLFVAGAITPVVQSSLGLSLFAEAISALHLAAVFVALLAQVQRYRAHSSAVERQQTKWVLFGLAGVVLAALGYNLIIELGLIPLGSDPTRIALFVIPLLGLTLCLFPVTMTISILRYRLFDIDVLIKRTVSYATLTAILGLIYLGAVILTQGALLALTGQRSALAIVASTLLIAALFNPLRQRIQAAIDRRLYRSRYDAAKTLESFGARIREQVDLNDLSSALLEVTEQSMQPEQVTLWLKDHR